MLRRLFFIAFLVLTVGGYAQISVNRLIEKGDSLVAVKNYDEAFLIYKRAMGAALDAKDTKKSAIIHKKLGVHYYRKKQYAKAEEQYRNSLKIDSTSKTAADAYYNTCLVKRKLNQLDSVLPYLEKSMVIYKKSEQDKATYNAYLNAGIFYKNRQLYDIALNYLLKADEGFKIMEDSSKQAKAANTIGNIHNRLKNYNLALTFHNNALNLGKKLRKPDDLSISYINIGNTYYNLKLHDSAITNYIKALEYVELGDSNYGNVLLSMANSYSKKGNAKMSRNYYGSSIHANKYTRDTTALLYSYNGITDLFLAQGDNKNATAFLDTISSLLPRTSDLLVTLDFHKNKAAYHLSTKNYKQAYINQSEYIKLFEKIYDLEQAETVQSLQSRFEYEKQSNENLQLSLANQNNLLLIEKQKNTLRNKNVILALMVVILFIVGIGYYLFVQRQKVKYQEVRIEKLEAIHKGQETIKKRISRDLHDIITTNFDGLRLKILAIPKSKNVVELTDGIAQNLTTINKQIRKVSHRLSPLEMHVKERPFTEIIKSQLTEFQLYRKIFVTLVDELPDELNALSVEVQNNVYSIMLEVLNNVDKHSHATELEVACHLDKKGYLHLELVDNGIGIDDSQKNGIGLMNIKQRAEILRGDSSIKKTDSGTKFHLSFSIAT